MPLTGAHLHAALSDVRAVGRQHRPLDELAAGANAALAAAPAGLTVDGGASCLATAGQESAYWRTTTEIGAEHKPYFPYIGRGYVQATHLDGYRGFGRYCHRLGLLADAEAFVKNPPLLADTRWAWLTCLWYFAENDLWRYANCGDHYAVSQAVNRGPRAIGGPKVPSHWPERDALFQAFRRLGRVLLPAPRADATGRKRRQQTLLT